MQHNSFAVRTYLLAVLGAALVPQLAFGQFTLSPVAVAGSDLGTAGSSNPFENMINQSGVQQPFVSGTTDFGAYFAQPGQAFATADYSHNWQSETTFNPPLQGYVDFDLGATYILNKLAIWNLSVKEVTVTVRDDLSGPGQAVGDFSLVNHLSFPFSYPVDILDFGADYQGRYVRLAIASTHTLAPPNHTFAFATIGEVVLSARSAAAAAVSIALNPDGDVTVSFSGTLQSATELQGTFDDVPGNPQGTYTIPKAALAARQYFRARAN